MATREQCKEALDLHERFLEGCANVVGMGVVERGNTDAVAVYVSKEPEENGRHEIPQTLEVGNVQVPVVLIVQGEVSLESL